MTKPRIAIGPVHRPSTVATVEAAGGQVVATGGDAAALMWLDPGDMAGLGAALAAAPAAGWVQLPYAGIEKVAAAGLAAGSSQYAELTFTGAGPGRGQPAVLAGRAAAAGLWAGHVQARPSSGSRGKSCRNPADILTGRHMP